MDTLWPLFGSGPLYRIVGDQLVDTCGDNWWKNVLMINNCFHILDNCANHTFWTAIDFQLFLVGLIALYLLIKSRRIGILFCIACAIFDLLMTGHMSIKHDTPHALAAYPMNVSQVLNYLDNIHDPSYNYFFTYMTGILVGIFLSTGGPDGTGGQANVGKLGMLVSFICCEIASYYTCFYNSIQVDRSWKPYFMAIGKICWAASNTLAILYFTYNPRKARQEQKIGIVDKKVMKQISRESLKRSNSQSNDQQAINGQSNDQSGINGQSNGQSGINGQQAMDDQTQIDGNQVKDQNNNVVNSLGVNRRDSNSARAGKEAPVGFGYRFALLVSRLSMALYLINYWFIRYDFFTTRQTFDVNPLSFVSIN